MDTILDKLSQKLTATEIIKANSEADAKELERIQEQVQQYNDCLEEMKKINGQTKLTLSEIEKTLQTGLESFKNAEIPTEGITKLVEESLAQIQALKTESADVQNTLEEKLTKQNEDMQAILEEKLSKITTDVNDYVHKECVKVYRNVQAVQVEENGKQTEALTTEIAKATGKAKAAWGVSIATLVFSILATVGVVFELLVMFGLLRF